MHRLGVEWLEARDLPAVPFQLLPAFPFQDLAALDHARAIFSRGQQLGRQANVVLKLGDSNSSPFITPHYLAPLGDPAYNPATSGLLAHYPALLDTWWEFRSGPDSLAHEGPTAWPGWRTNEVLATLAGEVRARNPAIALVMIGTNDAMVSGDASRFRVQLSRIVTTLLGTGVVPVLSTIPDSHFKRGKYQPAVMVFNQVISEVADRYVIPLWNAWSVLHRLPNHGLQADGVHLNASPNGAASFWPTDLLYAQNRRNLQALRILDWFRETVASGAWHVSPSNDWQPLDADRRLYALGRDVQFSPTVDVYDADTGKLVNRFLAFAPSFGGGVQVATGDTNGDGFTDIVCIANGQGVVKVVSGADGATLARFKPFSDSFGHALHLAVGDLDGDNSDEIVLAKSGEQRRIRIYDGGSFALRAEFRPFAMANGALRVAVADIEGLGAVVVVSGGRDESIVRFFNETGKRLSGFTSFVGPGKAIAAADLDGDGFDEVIVGQTSTRQILRVYDGALHSVMLNIRLDPVVDPTFGVRLGTIRSSNGPDTLLVGSAPGSATAVRGYDDLSGIPQLLPLERVNRAFGIFVG